MPAECRIAPNVTQNYDGAGACLIRVQDKIAVIRRISSGKYDLPRSSDNHSQQAQCAAHSATFNQTGFNVEVSHLLAVSGSGHRLFACRIDNGFNQTAERIEALSWLSPDVEDIVFVDPFITTAQQWQNPDELIIIRDAYVALGHVPIQALLQSKE